MNPRIRMVVILAIFLASLSAPAVSPAVENLVVLDLAAREPFRQSTADALTDSVITDLGSLGRYKVFPRPAVRETLDTLALSMSLDEKCDSEGCQEALGHTLGADAVVSGSIGLSGNLYLVTLSLRRIGSGRAADRRTWQCECPLVDLMSNITLYSRQLLGAAAEEPPQDESAWAVERRRRDEAERLRAAEEAARKIEDWLKSLGIEMVFIRGGEFDMGSNEHQDEEPVHRARVPDFQLARTEVTQAQWMAVMEGNPSRFKECPQCPVEQVSWEDAQAFILKLNRMTGKAFRLPTEAEWEYAAGGSGRRKWAGTDSEKSLKDYCWYESNSGGKTHPTALKFPNEFGLYDMSGNVAEWCSDWHGSYPSGFQDNPSGPLSGTGRVERGGNWEGDSWSVRVSHRFGLGPGYSSAGLGFRLALPAGR